MIRSKSMAGFTLVELIIVIVITGVVAAMITVFMKAPVDGYFSSIRRAALSEEADAALRFVARDLQAALPNSIACTGSGLQFLATRSGGRYREQQTSGGADFPLAFGNAITRFDIIGADAESVTKDARGNSVSGSASKVVVGNLSSGVANCHSDFSAFVSNAASLPILDANGVAFGSNTYPAECNMASANVQDFLATAINEINDREFGRFYVVNSTPVTYVCDTSSGLTKNGVGVVAASHVSACQVACDSTKARVQLITLNLTLKDRDNEPVNMLRRVTIVNRP